MMRLIVKQPGQAALIEAASIDIDAVRRTAEWVWLDMSEFTDAEVDQMSDSFGIDALSVQDVVDVTLFPKVDHHDDYLFVVLHGIVAAGATRLETQELDIIIGRDFLITAHRAPVVGIDWIIDQAVTHQRLALAAPADVAAAIAEAGSRRYLPLLDALDERIEALEDLALVADPRLLSESQALRRDVILLRRVLGPQREVLRELGQASSAVIDRTARREFSDVYDHHFRLVESLDAARALLGSVLDTYRGAVAERTNEVMKVLTVFSAVLLPLGLIAGLWGMNFTRVPGAEWHWGFVGLLSVMTVIAVGLWGYFARRGFVGGPKLSSIPKAVGLGLVHIGTAPLRVVGGLLESLSREARHDAPAGHHEESGPP